MDNFFNSLTGAFTDTFGGQNPFQFPSSSQWGNVQRVMDPQVGGNRGAPPASLKALRQLPLVKVAPEDLVDENNRECCICLEE